MSGINIDSIGLASGTGIANNKSLPQSPASMVSSESETQSISDEQTTREEEVKKFTVKYRRNSNHRITKEFKIKQGFMRKDSMEEGANDENSNSENRCPTCGQSTSASRISNHPQVCGRFSLAQFALLDSLDDIELFDDISEGGENGVVEIELAGDAERELNDTDELYIEYDLEPGQLIFINSVLAANLEEGDTDGLTPAMFIEGEGPENNSFRVLNLDTQDEEIINVNRLMIPLGLIPCILQTIDNGSGDENYIENGLEHDDQQNDS